ncbi:hypothetical protein QFC22_002994 [Naganishia vaughanmartiniae]|uniref:Uncharacterized protein n=1 Tax=Naganishia vaughanmartiniae TaxID=1424756 RepID=A0ACC2X8Y4_9TREE|nr:hypothetical protein QFC22_002994 [Naganishia vaughanmartiniae]
MTAKTAQRLSKPDEYAALLDRFDTFLFDCDGVIWTGSTLVPYMIDVLTMLRSKGEYSEFQLRVLAEELNQGMTPIGKNILFVTNNASKSREMYKKAFDGFGIQASVDEIFGSAYASAIYLSKILKFPADKKVYVIGQEGIEEELRSVGIHFTGGTDPEDRVFIPTGDNSSIKNDPSIGAVLCGGDQYINFKKYAKAHTYIMNNPECEFILTNGDASYPVADGTFPGNWWSNLRTYTGLHEENAYDYRLLLRLGCLLLITEVNPPCLVPFGSHEFDPKRTIMIGDNLETDILFGINSNIATLLVMTGVTTESQLIGKHKSDIVPDYIIQSMGDFAVLVDEM